MTSRNAGDGVRSISPFIRFSATLENSRIDREWPQMKTASRFGQFHRRLPSDKQPAAAQQKSPHSVK
jgi:hypothetical protein